MTITLRTTDTGAPAKRRPPWRRFAVAALATVMAAEAAARLLATGLEPVVEWPRSDYVAHQEGLAERGYDLDLLVVGSSVAGRAITPDSLEADGVTGPGYNHWLAGAPMRSVALLTTEVLVEQSTPSTVIVGLSMREFNDGPSQREHLRSLESSAGFLTASGRRSWIDTLDDVLQDNSALARHRLSFRDPVRLWHDLQAPPLVPEELGADGFMVERGLNQLADEPPEHLAQERQAMANYNVSAADVEALAQMVDQLRTRGIRVVVVNLPVTTRFIDLADDGAADYGAYLAAVRHAAEASGAEWLDTMTVPWPDRLFGDVNHLNDEGTDALEPMLASALAPPPSPSPPPAVTEGTFGSQEEPAG